MKHNDHRRESDTSGAMGFCGSVAEAGGVMEVAREMNRFQIICSRLNMALVRLRRKFPYLIWYGQQVDVLVTWKENKLQACDPSQVMNQLNGGHLYKIQQMMNEIGVTFDAGLGFEGRDWEWDWSLHGPISVTFKSACKTEDRRS